MPVGVMHVFAKGGNEHLFWPQKSHHTERSRVLRPESHLLLAVVRERFPHIATIAVSGEYIISGNPGIVAGAFLQKGHYTLKELCGEVAKLLAASPIRSESNKKSEIAHFSCRETTRDI
jgi:hypothetical protein